MPELPEVETIARGLDAAVRGRRIEAVEIHWARSVDARSVPLALLAGDTIASVGRLGKFVAVHLHSGRVLAVHLRMTGRLVVQRADDRISHERASMTLDDGWRIAFGDARKFGRFRLLEAGDTAALGVGVDPFDAALDAPAFARLVAKRRTPIKTLLLDQRRIAGIGNIYACEALYRARIRPRRQAGKLTRIEHRRLLRAVRQVLEKAIARRGSSVDDYVDAEGMQGGFQNFLTVYGRAGLPCRRCRTPIRRIVLGQRGTYYCPSCQR